MKYKKKVRAGIWFFGLSGSGKTFASKFISKYKKNCLIIDGDVVRKYVSFDLGYSKKDREKQIKRVLGISKIAIKSKLFPIISTVYMNAKIAEIAKLNKIQVIKIERDMKKIFKINNIYKNKKNVVSLDIKYPKIKMNKIFNSGNKSFYSTLKKLIWKIFWIYTKKIGAVCFANL